MAARELSGYKLTPKAERDLEEIWLYPRETQSPDQPNTYLNNLVHTIETLVAIPTIACERTEFAPPVRIHSAAEHLMVHKRRKPAPDRHSHPR